MARFGGCPAHHIIGTTGMGTFSARKTMRSHYHHCSWQGNGSISHLSPVTRSMHLTQPPNTTQWQGVASPQHTVASRSCNRTHGTRHMPILKATSQAQARTELEIRMRNFHFEQPVDWPDHPGSVIVVLPLSLEWRAPVAELLTDAFVEAAKFDAYRTLLKQRITRYLEAQVPLLPRTLILTATLRPPPELPGQEAATAANGYREAAVGAPSSGSSSSSSSNGTAELAPTLDASDDTTLDASASTLDACLELLQTLDVSQRNQTQGSGTQHTGLAGDGAGSVAQQYGLDGGGAAPEMSTNQRSGAQHSAQQSGQHSAQQSERQGDGQASSYGDHGGIPQGPVSSTTANQGSYAPPEELLGTVEVSFDRSTHSMNLTLNPPFKSAYLCNMAVHAAWRRRGVGLALIQAVEKACRMAGEQDLYLHLRFQDAAAGALYQSAGFTQAGADVWLVKLLGQDQKRLMLRKVPPGE